MMKVKSDSQDVNFLYEIGTLRRLKRQWSQFVDFPVASVAEHSFRVVWLTWIIAINESADVSKAIRMALIHDLGETRCGDRNYVQREYVATEEDIAIIESTRETSLSDEVSDLLRELSEGKSLEAMIVKDADSLDVDLELREMMAAGIDFPSVMQLTRKAAFNKLKTRSAVSLFNTISSSKVEAWHISARNRLNSGEWSK